MASATVDSTADDGSLPVESIPTIDLRVLSQSELYALSRCSDAAFDPRRCDDVVIPKIDRTVFNESAGSRKQTYSRLRLAPAASSASILRRTPHLRAPKPSSIETDPERAENSQIIGILKELFASQKNGNDLVPIQVEYSNSVPDSSNAVNIKGGDENSSSVIDLSNPAKNIGRVEYINSIFDFSNSLNNNSKRKRGRPRKNENVVVPAKNEIQDIVVYKSVEGTDYKIVDSASLNEGNSNGKKRKRGRPRKSENAVVVPAKNEVKDIVIYENVKERDKGIVNLNGLTVDVVALAGLEDPFGPEIRRRTQGLEREDQLLGFLEGLGGQWVSRRKKKKIVDAGDFGNYLPKDWKISISLKRKEGRVWLFCRRYISPSGRQFVSCKEVSSYLLSICVVQDNNQPNCTHSNENVQDAFKLASGSAADLAVLVTNTEIELVSHSSVANTSITSNQEMQNSMKIGEPVEVQVEETLKCHKCMMSFNEKDDLLHHNLLSHRRRRSKLGTSITDGVIIRGGQYECQFCHKTFDERNRYNGHVGAHVKNDVKTNADPSSLGEVSNGESLIEAINLADGDLAAETIDKNVKEEFNSDIHHSVLTGSSVEASTDKLDYDQHYLANDKEELQANRNEANIDEQDREYPSSSDKTVEVEESMDILPDKSNLTLDSKATLSNSGKYIYEASVETNVIKNVSNGKNDCLKRSFQTCLSHPDEKRCGIENYVIEVSASVQEISKEAVTGSGALTPNCIEKPYDIDNMCSSSMMDEVKPDRERFATTESVSGPPSNHATRDKNCMTEENCVTEVKQHISSDSPSLVSTGNEQFCTIINVANELITSKITVPEQTGGSGNCMLAASGEVKTCIEDNVDGDLTSSVCPQFGILKFGSSDCRNYAESQNALTSLEEKPYESRLTISSSSERAGVTENDVSTGVVEGLRQQQTSLSSLLSLSGHEQSSGFEKYVDALPARKMEESERNEVKTCGNSELIASFGSSYYGLNAGVSSTKERSLEFCSLFPSGTEEIYGVQENLTGVRNPSVEEDMQEHSKTGLLAQSCFAENSNVAYNLNKNYNTPVDDAIKFNDAQTSGNRELSLAFDNPRTGLYEGAPSFEHEKYPANYSVVPSRNEQNFGLQANLSRVNNCMVEEQGIGSLSGLFSLSCNGKFWGSENNFNTVYSGGSVWGGPEGEEVRNSENLVGFGRDHGQPSESVLSSGLWRTRENAPQSSLANASNRLLQSASSFHTTNMITNKVDDGLFRLDEKYGTESCFEGPRTGRTEPVEFSFLTTQNSNSQGRPKNFSYGEGMGHEFDSSFWLGKDNLMTNIASRGQVTTLCVWCRNEFHHEPVHSEAQVAIGSICPTCRGGI